MPTPSLVVAVEGMYEKELSRVECTEIIGPNGATVSSGSDLIEVILQDQNLGLMAYAGGDNRVTVTAVTEGSVAQKLGILVGDIISVAGGQHLTSVDQFQNVLQSTTRPLKIGFYKSQSHAQPLPFHATSSKKPPPPPPSGIDSSLPAGWTKHADATSGKTYYHNTALNISSWDPPPTPTFQTKEERRQLFFRTTRIVLDGGPDLLLRPLFRTRWNKCFPGHEWYDGGDVEEKKAQGDNFFFGPKDFLGELWTQKVTRGYDHFQLSKDHVKEWAKKVAGYASSDDMTDEDTFELLNTIIGDSSLIDIDDKSYRVSKQGIVTPSHTYYWRLLELDRRIEGPSTKRDVELLDPSSKEVLWKQPINFGVSHLELKKKDVQKWAVLFSDNISADSSDEEIWETFKNRTTSIEIKDYGVYTIKECLEPWQVVKLTSKIDVEGEGIKDEELELKLRFRNKENEKDSFIAIKNSKSIGESQYSLVLSGEVNKWDSTLLSVVFTTSAYSGLLMPPVSSPSNQNDPDWATLRQYVKKVKDTRNVAYGHMESTDKMELESYIKCKQSYLDLARQIDEFIKRDHMHGACWKVENTGS